MALELLLLGGLKPTGHRCTLTSIFGKIGRPLLSWVQKPPKMKLSDLCCSPNLINESHYWRYVCMEVCLSWGSGCLFAPVLAFLVLLSILLLLLRQLRLLGRRLAVGALTKEFKVLVSWVAVKPTCLRC